MIPRTMSFFWANQPMSWARYLTIYSFRKLHPDWKIVLYESKTAPAKNWRTFEQQDGGGGVDWRDQLRGLRIERRAWTAMSTLPSIKQADLCKWETLGHRGGWVSDMDILWVRPLPEWAVDGDWDVVFCLHRDGSMTNGFGASRRGGHVVFRLIENVAHRQAVLGGDSYQAVGVDAVLNAYGSQPIKCIVYMHPGIRLLSLPHQTAYPFDSQQIPAIWKPQPELTDDVCGLHWYGGHPLSQQWACAMTPEVAAVCGHLWGREANRIWTT